MAGFWSRFADGMKIAAAEQVRELAQSVVADVPSTPRSRGIESDCTPVEYMSGSVNWFTGDLELSPLAARMVADERRAWCAAK